MIVEPLQLIVAAAFPNEKLAPGFPPEQMAAAEARLNLVLPEPLKDYYAVAGGSRDLMRVNYRMAPPDKLRVDGDHLIFCEENQGLEDFGIPVAELASPAQFPNPSVDVRPKGKEKWFGQAGALTAFLLGMEAWQAVLSLPEKARCELPSKDLKQLLAFFEPVGASNVRVGGDMFGLVDRQRSIVAAYVRTEEMLYVGSSSETALEELEEKSGLDFESL